LKKFRENGLEPPQTVKDATEDYKNDSDKIGKFIEECLEKSQGKYCTIKDVYINYETWCNDNGYGCENRQNFTSELKYKKIYAETGTINGKTEKRVVRGYIIKDENNVSNKSNTAPPPSDKNAPTENIKIKKNIRIFSTFTR